MRFASIDVGTNTVRLLIAETEGEQIRPIVVRRSITRLGGGFSKTGISAEAAERTLAALEGFAGELRNLPVQTLRAVATSAVRDAANGAAFCSRVLAHTGIALEVIDGDEEALLTLRGALAGVGDNYDNVLVFDIGGGSTEFTLARQGEVVFARSLPLGVVRLTEGKRNTGEIRSKVLRELGAIEEGVRAAGGVPPGTVLIGTAGTATTLAAIDLGMTDYDYRRVNGHSMPYTRVRGICDRLLALTPQERLLVPGLEKGREDLIGAGATVVLAVMETLGFDSLTVSDYGLLEGTLLSVSGSA